MLNVVDAAARLDTVQENTLLVSSKPLKEEERKNGNGYLHRGMARRAFERRFSLADHMKVTGARLDNGMPMSSWYMRCPRPRSRAKSRSAPDPCRRR